MHTKLNIFSIEATQNADQKKSSLVSVEGDI